MTVLLFDVVGFLGRFHPLVVHLPIGFLLLGGIMEYLYRRQKIADNSHWIFLCGAVAAVVAVGLGWMLAQEGGYDESTLFWHRWLGVGVAVLALVIWLSKMGKLSLSSPVFSILLVTLIGMISVTGHFGGNLTHGAGYLLEHAPEGVQKLLGKAQKDPVNIAADPDSVIVFEHLILPLLENRCIQCHNEDKMKGKLNLASKESIEVGGDDGSIIEAGSAMESELFKRITLPQDHKKFMPTNGNTPLSYNEVKLIGWWIDSGADFEASVVATGVPTDIKFVLAQSYGLDTDPKSYVERAVVPAAASEVLVQLQEAGFQAQPIASNNNFIEVKRKYDRSEDNPGLSLLQEAQLQVTWLHLSSSNITDEDLKILSSLENLTLLRLNNNDITDEGVKALEGLAHLESLNLYGTKVTGAVLETLKTLPALKKVFLWQTAVSPEDVERIREELPDLEVDAGVHQDNL